jgi:hypothetical protein
VAKVAKVRSKMATRLPSTGVKGAKMAKLMGYSAAFAALDGIDTFRSGAGERGGWRRRRGCTGAR